MKITGARLSLITVHTHEPFKIALETLYRCHGILLELQTDSGISGLGEATPARRITGETHDTVVSVIQTALLPAIQGSDPFALEEIHHRMDESIWGNPAAKAAVDLACYDIIGKATSNPVVSLLGGISHPLRTDHTIAIKAPVEQAKEAQSLVKRGFGILKVKLGADEAEDVDRVKAIRDAVGPDVLIRIDANQGWNVPGALRVLETIAPYNIELAEQPLNARDLKGMAYLRKRSPIPIAADESVHSPQDAIRAIELETCDIINIKLMKCGGIYRALQIAAIAEAANIRCMIGGMIGESRLAVGAAASFAAARRVVQYYDLDADLLLKDDLVIKGGIATRDGSRVLPETPGLGVGAFDQKFLQPYGALTV